jgi:adenylate cyclase
MKKRKIVVYIVVPIVLALAAFLLSMFGIFGFTESACYDFLLEIKPIAPPEKSILLVDCGNIQADNGCADAGESLLLLKELGVKYLVITNRFGDPENPKYGTCGSLEDGVSVTRNTFLPVFVNSNVMIRRFDEPARNTLVEIGIRNITVTEGNPKVLPEILIPTQALVSSSMGSGFILESDSGNKLIHGIPLVAKYKETLVSELGFRVVRELLGNPAISVEDDKIVLKGAGLIGETKRTITLRLTSWNGLPINLPMKGITGGMRKISLASVSEYDANIKKLHTILREMSRLGYLSFYQRSEEVFDSYGQAERMKESLVSGNLDGGIDSYRATREIFFEEAERLLKSSAEDEVISYLSKKRTGGRSGDVEAASDAASRFKSGRETLAAISNAREKLAKECNGAIALLTTIPSSGARPLASISEKNPWNGIITAGVISTILSEKFVTVLPFWYGSIVALVLSLCVSLLLRRLTFLPSILIGISVVLFMLVTDISMFVFFGSYSECIVPASAVLCSALAVSVYGLVMRKTELFFLKASVTGKLSEEAINRIIIKPESAHTDGEKLRVSVLASEIRAFASIASKMEPAKLIESLRSYHGEMGAVLLSLQATIDTHEQDSTVAFFGSPLATADHAAKACTAALRMRKLDRSLNKYFMGSNLSVTPFNTRFAIATGDMVSGNIGNDLLPDFTVVGPVTDIAKQLRKVNSLYGTAILIPESTFRVVKNLFAVRQLDRVRIARVRDPIRIYELIAEKEATTPQVGELVELFHDAIYLFEKREWQKALARFQKALSVAPKDMPSRVFASRCKAFMKKPPQDKWDGVFKVTTV